MAPKDTGKASYSIPWPHASCGTLLWPILDVSKASQAVNCLLTFCCARKLGCCRLGVYDMMKYKSLQRDRHDKYARRRASQFLSRSFVTRCSVTHACSIHDMIYPGVLETVTSRVHNSLMICLGNSRQTLAKGIAIANACEESSTQTNRLF